MYCSQCGKKISGDARYCPNCGTRQEMGVVPAEGIFAAEFPDEKKKRRAHRQGRRLGNLLVTVIALLILFTADEEIPAVGLYAPQQMDASRFVIRNQKEMVICSKAGETCAVDIPQTLLYSADHGRMAYLDRDQELYYMDDMEPVFVDDGVTTAELSFYGETLVYLKQTDDGRQELCAYIVRDGTRESVAVENCREFVLSPNGKTAAWVGLSGGGSMSVWSVGGGSRKAAGSVSEILAVSDDGKEILYRKDNDSLFLLSDGEDRKLASVGGAFHYVLNESQKEILYTEDGNTWYYSVDRREPVRLTGVKGVLETSCYTDYMAYQQRKGLVLGRKTLKNMTFAALDTRDHSCRIYRLDGNGKKAETILNHAEQFQVAQDGQSLLYLSGWKLYRIGDIRYHQERDCLSDTLDVIRFLADQELKKIWLVASDNRLYYMDGKECVSVSDDLSQMYGSYRDGILFREGRDLYYAEGKEKTLIQEEVDDVSIQEKNYVIVDTDSRYCYLKDLDESIELTDSRQGPGR